LKTTFKILLVFFIHFPLKGNDTLLHKIIDAGKPIKTLLKDENGEILVQVLNQLYKIKNNNLVKSNFSEINNNDKFINYKGKITSVKKLEEKGIIYNNVNYQYKNWVKLMAKVGPENFIEVVEEEKSFYWVVNGSRFLYCFQIETRFNRNLKQISTRGILKIKEDTYVGSYSGIYKNGIRVFPEIEHVNSNLIFHDDTIFFTTSKELYSLDLLKNKLSKIYIDKTNEFSSVIYFKDKLWIGSYNGLFSLNSKYEIKNEGFNDLVHNLKIYNNQLFICAKSGIFKVENDKISKLIKFDKNIEYNDIVFKNDIYYIATSRGLYYFDQFNNVKKNIFEKTMARDYEFFSIETDDFYNLWVSSIAGLFKYNLMNFKTDIYYEGLEFNKRSTLKYDNQLYFGSTDGYLTFSPVKFYGSDLISAENQTDTLNTKMIILNMAIIFVIFLGFIAYYRHKIKKINERNKNTLGLNVTEESKNVKNNFSMNNIEKYILENLDNITVEKLREDSGLSKNVFYRVFAQQYDISPKQLIEKIKEESIRKKKGYKRKEQSYHS